MEVRRERRSRSILLQSVEATVDVEDGAERCPSGGHGREPRRRVQQVCGCHRLPHQRRSLTTEMSPVAEAEQALISLGYKPAEAQKAVAHIKNQHENTADLIRAALKAMVK